MFKIHVSYYLTFFFFVKLATCHYLVSGIGKISHKTTLAIAFFTMPNGILHSKIFEFLRQKWKFSFCRQISNACQRFIPPEVKYEEPKSHSVEEGSYFPNIGGSSNSQGQPPANNNHVGEPVEQSSSSVSTTSSSTTVTNNERQPKQDLAEEEIRAYSDNEGEDESINFDEFFDLAVYKNLLSSSPPQKMMSQSGTSLLLFFAFILSMFMA